MKAKSVDKGQDFGISVLVYVCSLSRIDQSCLTQLSYLLMDGQSTRKHWQKCHL